MDNPSDKAKPLFSADRAVLKIGGIALPAFDVVANERIDLEDLDLSGLYNMSQMQFAECVGQIVDEMVMADVSEEQQLWVSKLITAIRNKTGWDLPLKSKS